MHNYTMREELRLSLPAIYIKGFDSFVAIWNGNEKSPEVFKRGNTQHRVVLKHLVVFMLFTS